MGDIKYSGKDQIEARNALKYLVDLIKSKNIHEDHLIIYQFMIFYGTMFLEKSEALNIVKEMQDVFEPDKTFH